MDITIGRDELLGIAQKCHALAKDSRSFPMLKNLKLLVNSGYLFAEATDLNVSLKCRINLPKDGNFLNSENICVSASKLHDIVRELPKGSDVRLKLSKDETALKISFGKSRFSLAIADSTGFPEFPSCDGDFQTFQRSKLLEILKGTAYAMANDENRPTLSSVYWEVSSKKGGSTRMVAADSHRLAIADSDSSYNGGEFKVSIPRQMVNELLKLLRECKDEKSRNVEFKISGNHIVFFIPETQVMVAARLLENGFPDYSNVIKQATNKKAVIDSAEFVSGLKRTVILANEEAKMIKLEFLSSSTPGVDKGKLIISSQGGDMGDAQDEMFVDFEGDDIKIGVNAKYVIDAINALNSPFVTLSMSEELKPLVVTTDESGGDKSNLCKMTGVVMPMRLVQ